VRPEEHLVPCQHARLAEQPPSVLHGGVDGLVGAEEAPDRLQIPLRLRRIHPDEDRGQFCGYATDLGQAVWRGPKTVMSAASTDGEFTADVEDLPSFDPPNQALFVERQDKRHFRHIADLAEDADAIEKVLRSPDSRIVIFHSRDYLTATRVADWQTVRVFLGQEWIRSRAGRQSTFTSGGRGRTVTAIQFEGPNSLSHQLKDDPRPHRLDFSPDTAP